MKKFDSLQVNIYMCLLYYAHAHVYIEIKTTLLELVEKCA